MVSSSPASFDISGKLHEEVIRKLPFKDNVIRKDSASKEEKRINFFKGPLPLSNTQQ